MDYIFNILICLTQLKLLYNLSFVSSTSHYGPQHPPLFYNMSFWSSTCHYGPQHLPLSLWEYIQLLTIDPWTTTCLSSVPEWSCRELSCVCCCGVVKVQPRLKKGQTGFCSAEKVSLIGRRTGGAGEKAGEADPTWHYLHFKAR